jgi:hypothetical protein
MIPIVVTLVGIVTDVSDEHDMKAHGTNDGVRVGSVSIRVGLIVHMIDSAYDSDNDSSAYNYDDDNNDDECVPILVVLLENVIAQVLDVHRLQQPEPSLLLQVTYGTNDNSNDNSSSDDSDNNDSDSGYLPHSVTDVAPGSIVVDSVGQGVHVSLLM